MQSVHAWGFLVNFEPKLIWQGTRVGPLVYRAFIWVSRHDSSRATSDGGSSTQKWTWWWIDVRQIQRSAMAFMDECYNGAWSQNSFHMVSLYFSPSQALCNLKFGLWSSSWGHGQLCAGLHCCSPAHTNDQLSQKRIPNIKYPGAESQLHPFFLGLLIDRSLL